MWPAYFKRTSYRVPSGSKSNRCTLLFGLCLGLIAWNCNNNASGQSASEATPGKTHSEYWVGWMETADRQLRWVVQFNRSNSSDGPIVSAYTWNPDISDKPNPLTQFAIDDQYWKLEWQQSGAKENLKYEAIQESENRATGFIIISDKTLAVPLNKVLSLPDETARNLGADIVWLDQSPPSPQNPNAKRFDLRLRFYTEGPFAAEGPRIVLDSMAAQLMGVPVELQQNEDEYLQFQIPAIKASYKAMLDENEEMMSGKFQRNDVETDLALHLLKEQNAKPEKAEATAPAPPNSVAQSNSTSQVPSKSTEEPPAMPSKDKQPESQPVDTVKINIRKSMPSKLTHDLAPNEKAFTLDTRMADTSPAVKGQSASVPRVLGGTVSYSISRPDQPAPALIILSTYDANDRDGTVGASKFYKQLAHWFAEKGVATVRFDDRGVGESFPVENMSSEDQKRDLDALIEMLRSDPQIAPDQIGFFGHGEGANLAMNLSASDPRIAFNVLFAPPGVNGFELTRQRLVSAAMAQGLVRTDAERLADFQRSLQDIALRFTGDKTQQVQQVKTLVAEKWSKIGPLTGANSDFKDADERTAAESRLLTQVAGFDTPLVRDALVSEPSTNWMLGASPTLVMFGGRDGIIPPNINAEPLKTAALRGGEGRFNFVELPKVNHWFNSSTASGKELEESETSVDDGVYKAINDWMQKRGM